MSIRSTATRLGALVGAAALLGGIALTAGSSVFAQAGASPTATAAGPTPAVNLGGPAQVPAARVSGTVNAPNGTAIVASVGSTACGFGTVTNGSYYVDIQFITGCSTPGAAVTFSVGGSPATASPAVTVPPNEGSAVVANLTVSAATATPATTPPPPPTVAKTTTPPPPPTTAPKTASPTPAKTTAPTTAPTKAAQAPSAQKPAGAQAPAGAKPAAAQAPAGVRLPNTGNGGVNSSSAMGFGLIGILLGALTLTASGIAAYRRSR